MIEIRLPVPPSTNNLYANRGGAKGYGRIKTKKYKAWIREADGWFLTQARKLPRERVTGPCKVLIRIPKVRGDISNRTKAAEDWLVSRNITSDDRNNTDVHIKVDKSLTDHCVVTVGPAE